MSVARPPKRTRVNDSLSSHSPPRVKYERSPSPLAIARRLVTSGTKRYAPVPNDCLSSCPEYKRNRSEWAARCVKELEVLNLIPERKLVRDDGLIVDWRSHVPVWSDTLKPDQLDLAATIMLTHRSNAQWHLPHAPESHLIPVSTAPTPERGTQSSPKKRLSAPLRSSSERRNNLQLNLTLGEPGSSTLSSGRSLVPDQTQCRMASTVHRVSSLVVDCIPPDIANSHLQVVLPSRPHGRTSEPSTTTPSAAEELMSEVTLDYLRRYVQTYEVDRASLASAYARNASFAYRVHQIVQNCTGALSIWAASPQCFSSGSKRTRLDIATTLLTLPCLHTNAQSLDIAQVGYDMFYLGAQLGIYVVCRVVISTKTVVHNFILQRKEVDVEDATIEGVWPLTATAHQIIVFQI